MSSTKAHRQGDHRTRVGQERRARTQAKIIHAALSVFAKKGPEAAVIDDVILAAGVARGTFYNYYKSIEELFEATSNWLEDDLILSINTELGHVKDPVQRLSASVRLWMKKAESDPLWCAFIARLSQHGHLVERQLTKDLRDGSRIGAFSFPSVKFGRDLVVGTVREAMNRMTRERVSKTYAEDVTRMVLNGLGLERHAIDLHLAMPLPRMRRPTQKIG